MGILDTPGLTRGQAEARLGRATTGNRLRRALNAARRRNSPELGLMTTPPVVTTSLSGDAALTKNYLVSNNTLLPVCRLVGGTPTVYASSYYRMPVVTMTSAGNAVGNQSALSFAAEFVTDSMKVQIRLLNTTIPQGVRFEVDNQYVSQTPTPYPGSSGSGYFTLDFTGQEKKPRKIRVELNLSAAIYGISVLPTASIWKAASSDEVIAAYVGDSVSASTGCQGPNTNWQSVFGKLVGITDNRQIAIGSSGFTVAPTSGNVFGDPQRVADAVAANPDILFISGSINDDGRTGIQAAALAAFQAYRAALPLIPIVVIGTWAGNTGPRASNISNEASIAAAFSQWGDSNSFYIPCDADPSPWIFGTGWTPPRTPTVSLGTTSPSGGTFASGTYYWVVEATYGSYNSAKSNEVSATLAANGSQVLNWPVDVTSTGYKIYRGTSSGGQNVLVATVGAVGTYTDTGVAGTAATPPAVSATQNNSGNTDLYVSADQVHPNDAGHEYWGRRVAHAFQAVVLPNLP